MTCISIAITAITPRPQAMAPGPAPEGKTNNMLAAVQVTPLAEPVAIKLSSIKTDKGAITKLPNQANIPMARCLGIPLRIIRLESPSESCWPKRENRLIRLFDRVVDPTDSQFGEVSTGRLGVAFRKGCMLLYRRDGQAFEPKHAEALLVYCGKELEELHNFWSDHYVGTGEVRVMEARVLEAREVSKRLLTPEAFARFFAAYRAKQTKGDESWKKVKCPVTGSCWSDAGVDLRSLDASLVDAKLG
ncbi:hypothetical protein LTR36_009221 [Oleoguttula mirabilis]|uniref:Uncharacterized protein n=1 Tax=Oleoguttula mirabilis TaxID=1507867 RepID=A0AAV9J6Y3_9PEZI|nr:hypothetical protein LTR36_009221 [Oleoguttula mirabilis]